MGFLNTVLSILPKIGPVVGSLFGANSNDYLRFSLRMPGEKINKNDLDDGNVYFKKDGDDIIAYNLTKDTVQISFPAENNTFGDSIVIPECSPWDITENITTHAQANVDNFEIVRGGNPAPENALECTAVLSASGKISKKTSEEQKIGTNISIKLSNNDLTVKISKYTLNGITSLIISGEGNETQSKYQNVMLEGAKASELTLQGAVEPYKFSNNLFLELSVSCTYSKAEMEAEIKKAGIKRLEKKDLEFLKTGRCLNM